MPAPSPLRPPFDGLALTEDALARLPIFPLPNVVLLPGVGMPLHIFEPRYREMLATCLSEERVLAMALLAEGHPPDERGRPPVYETLCGGLILAAEALPDGRSNILVYGTQRLRIVRELDTDEPFRRVQAEPVPDVRSPAAS